MSSTDLGLHEQLLKCIGEAELIARDLYCRGARPLDDTVRALRRQADYVRERIRVIKNSQAPTEHQPETEPKPSKKGKG